MFYVVASHLLCSRYVRNGNADCGASLNHRFPAVGLADCLAFPVAFCGVERKTIGWKGKTSAVWNVSAAREFAGGALLRCATDCLAFSVAFCDGEGKTIGWEGKTSAL